MIKGSARVYEPELVVVQITMEAPVSEWRHLLDQLDKSAWPSWQVASVIRKSLSGLVEHVERVQEDVQS